MIAGPLGQSAIGFAMTLALLPAGLRAAWFLLGRSEKVTLETAATALALLMLQRRHAVLQPTLTAPAEMPAVAFIDERGRWMDHRRVRFPLEILNEVERIARWIMQHHGALVRGTLAACRGTRPDDWMPYYPAPATASPTGDVGNQTWRLELSDPTNECSIIPALPDGPPSSEALADLVDRMSSTLVEHDYQHRPYLRRLSLEELSDRASDALRNLLELDAPGSWRFNPHDFVSGRAFVRYQETVFEVRRRDPKGVEEFMQRLAPNLGIGDTPEWRRTFAWFSRYSSMGPCHARFGRRAHLEAMLQDGMMRLGPTSSYADPSLTSAQQDDEASVVNELDVERCQLSIYDEDDPANAKSFAPLRASTRRQAPSDAYVFCVAQRVSPRLLHDFKADACLLIQDPLEFTRRLAIATEHALPGWRMEHFGLAPKKWTRT